jgi:hypothetical protein
MKASRIVSTDIAKIHSRHGKCKLLYVATPTMTLYTQEKTLVEVASSILMMPNEKKHFDENDGKQTKYNRNSNLLLRKAMVTSTCARQLCAMRDALFT